MPRPAGRRYLPTGPVVRTSREFYYWGPIPEGYDVRIEIRDLYSERDHHTFAEGYHKVIVEGPQPRPRSKSFIGEVAWCSAERYAGDCVSEIQRNERRNPNSPHFCETGPR